MNKRLFRLTFWLEIAALILTALAFIMPLKYSVTWLDLQADDMVSLYYIISTVAIVISQVGYILAMKTRRVKIIPLAVGSVVIISLVSFWLMRANGRIMDFSELATGELTGTVIFALAFSTIQAVLSIVVFVRE
jgi:hypothetical protein